jgi:TonB family protein
LEGSVNGGWLLIGWVVSAVCLVLLVGCRTLAGTDSSGAVRTPYFEPPSRDYYPTAAKHRGDTGVVDLEFSIDGRGNARDVKQVYAATDELGASTRSLLKDVQFHVPPGWEDKGYQKLRFTIEAQYFLAPCGKEMPTRVSDAQLVVICGSR